MYAHSVHPDLKFRAKFDDHSKPRQAGLGCALKITYTKYDTEARRVFRTFFVMPSPVVHDWEEMITENGFIILKF